MPRGRKRLSIADAIERRIHRLPDEHGGHWIWCGSMSGTRVGGSGGYRPQVNCGGVNVNARSMLMGVETKGARIVAKCGEVRCVNPEHCEVDEFDTSRLIARQATWGIPSEAQREMLDLWREGQLKAREWRTLYTLQAIGNKFDLTRERVRQIIKKFAADEYKEQVGMFGLKRQHVNGETA